MKVFITGCSGLIGSELVSYFDPTARSVIGIDNNMRADFFGPEGDTRWNLQRLKESTSNFTAYDVDLRDRESLSDARNLRRINTLTPSHHRWERRALPLELAPYRLDIYHTPDAIPVDGGARRCVITIHDLHFLHYPQFMTPASRRHYNDQIAWAVRRADAILVSSESTRRDLSTLLGVPEDKVTVDMLGVDHTRFRPQSATEVAAVRSRLGLPEAYLLFVGTFEPRKNIPGLLRAYARLRARLPDAPPLVLAGRRGWLDDAIYRTADELQLGEAVIWVENPSAAELPALYGGAAALALLSHYEGFGLTALEAMACGTPPVAADRSSIPEVVGNAGLLVNPDDPEAAADALARLLTDSELRADLSARGLARAAGFTWQRTAETVLQTYHAVLN